MSKEFDKEWIKHRIEYYNKRVARCYELASKCEGDEREGHFDDAHLFAQAVSYLEKGSAPPKALPTKEYYIEKEGGGCDSGACAI
jgi:hypothetical protein